MLGEAFGDALRSILRKWKRSMLTAIGIAIGVMSVVLISSIGAYGTGMVTTELESLGLGGIMVSTSDASRYPSIDETEIRAIKSFAQVKYAMPLMMLYSTIQAENAIGNALIFGVDEGADRLISLDILHGKGILRSDVINASSVCLIDRNFALAAFGTERAVGEILQIGINGIYESYRVIGITKTGSGLLQSSMGNYLPSFVYVPYSSLQRSLGQSGFQQIAVRIGEELDPDQTGAHIVQLLENTTGLHGKYVAENLSQEKDGLYSLLNTVSFSLTSIGAISLIVACLSIMTTMMISVHERTKEIGIKKSLGATKGNILIEFLCEAALICFFGSLLGIGISCLLIFGLSLLFSISFPIQADILLTTSVVTVLTGIIFGIYPALRAASLDPVNALRTE